MKEKEEKVYVKISTISKIGDGLFAKVPMKSGEIITEFKGKLKGNKEKSNERSTLYFSDGTKLDCHPDCLATFSNDVIIFPTERRKLLKSLRKEKPFYYMHGKAKINAKIKINDILHRGFLEATQDIEQDEEIFCHYGFSYWFNEECFKKGFLKEEEIDEKGFPEDVTSYPAFEKYIEIFYPDHLSFYNEKGILHILFENDKLIKIPLINLNEVMKPARL